MHGPYQADHVVFVTEVTEFFGHMKLAALYAVFCVVNKRTNGTLHLIALAKEQIIEGAYIILGGYCGAAGATCWQTQACD